MRDLSSTGAPVEPQAGEPRRSMRSSTHGLRVAAVLVAATGATAACMSGRVLSGYPGYPFASFTVSRSEEEVFPAAMQVLEEESYPIDYTDRESGFIQTRVGPDPAKPVLLNVVVGADPDSVGKSRVWVAGFEHTRTGDRRINPLDPVLWKEVESVSQRLSERLGGTPPVAPE